MSDVSVPPTHPDDEVITRKILREEFQAHEVKMGRALTGMEESIISKMVALMEPTKDHGKRITELEAKTATLILRTNELAAGRRARRPSKRKPTKK